MKTQLVIFVLISLFNSQLHGQTGFVAGETNLAYWEIGKKKHTVIILHGGPCAEHQYLRPEFDGLSDVARIIYYDQRGCGKSSMAESYHWTDHVEDLNRLIQSLSPEGKVFLAGSSWGSWLALLFAYTYPDNVNGLILSGLVGWEGKEMGTLEYKEYESKLLKNVKGTDIYQFDIIENQIKEIINDDGTTEKVKVEIIRPVILNNGRRMSESRISLVSAPILDSLNQIKVPCLIFNGPSPCIYDKVINKYAEILENSWVVSIEGGCHDPWLANPEIFQNKAQIFINQLKRRKKNTLTKLEKKLN